MKKQYIEPSTFCIKLNTRRFLLQTSPVKIDNGVIDNPEDDAGWAREDNSDDNDNNRGNIWDNAW